MSNSNLPTITVDDFSKIVEMQFNEKNYRPIFGIGKGGIGKTESIFDLAKNKLNIGYIDIRLLLYSETDLRGIPYPDEHHAKTIWLQNNTLPTVDKDGETGILVFDEITSCTRSVRTAAYQLLNERRLSEYELPSGWMIVCLVNGEEDGGDYQGMEGNFANRCSVYNVVADADSWKKWAMKHGVNDLVTSYVSWKPEDLHSMSVDSETEILFSSPRSWKAVSDILNVYGYNENDTILHKRIFGNVGTRVGQQFISFCKFKNETVDPKQIVSGLAKPQLKNREVMYITIGSVIKLIGDSIKSDMEASGGAVTLNTIGYMANGLRWILSLQKEYAVMGFKDLIAYNDKIIPKLIMSAELREQCPEILQFAQDNRTIFS